MRNWGDPWAFRQKNWRTASDAALRSQSEAKPEVRGFAEKFGRKESKQSGGAQSMIRKSGHRFSEKDHAPPKIQSMIRKKPAPDLMRGGSRFCEKITLKQRAGIWMLVARIEHR
jgi:hypothetical protein